MKTTCDSYLWKFIGKIKDSWTRDADTMVRKHTSQHFGASRWEIFRKVKKTSLLAGEVSQKAFLTFPRCMGSTKKCFPCSMGRPKLTFATPLERECKFERLLNFCCCGFLWIWGRKRSILAGSFKEKLKMTQKHMICLKLTKLKMLLKPLVGARFWSEEVTTTKVSICAP